MIISFHLKYTSSFGESLFICGNNEKIGNDQFDAASPLTFLNKDYWVANIEIDEKQVQNIQYKYLLKNKDGILIIEGEKERKLILTGKSTTIIDIWNYSGDYNNCFYTQPFLETLAPHLATNKRLDAIKSNYLELRVKAPLLKKNETVCIIGGGKEFNNWSTEKPQLLSYEGSWYVIRLKLPDGPEIIYKYGVYNVKDKKFEFFESGENRVLQTSMFDQQQVIIHDGFFQNANYWKGAGVAVPVFSLRSKQSFGSGEFTDLKLLVDWAKQTGLKIIQLLPVNDTTAHHSEQDSYPYAAISAFALHPLYINLFKVGAMGGHEILKSLKKKQKELNDLADLDYEQVMKLKISLLKELYVIQGPGLLKDKTYLEFIEENKNWLKAYAAFCYLRDKNGTADFTLWKNNAVYDELAIDKMLSAKHGNEIRFYFFVQFHLHLQLKEAVKYAHENHIILKGDIPIGVFRNGCDAWMHPHLFNMEEQSGAPPDDFAIKGQNWGFPTYNWKKMQEDGFQWWNARFRQMNHYFDAFRIDHILGFFRIWSIPLNAVEGILGRFTPAIPIYKSELDARHINFDHDRFCKPYITDQILNDYFGEEANFVKAKYLESNGMGQYDLLKEFNTQRKVEKYFDGLKENSLKHFRNGLKELISNVILIEDPHDHQNEFHFRIAMDTTRSYAALDDYSKQQLKELYINYFYHRQEDLWRREAMIKLPALKSGTNMLICGEDLGMVPSCVHSVMSQLGILSLEIQRMPKDPATEFFHPKDAPYLSVVTPSTHDMSTIRGWWEEDRVKTQRFYHFILGHYGEAPYFCDAWINKEIIIQHLYSPAMWAIFQLQDLLGMDEKIRRKDPEEERINIPSDPNHYWRYRMHLYLEDLIKEKAFNNDLKEDITKSGRA